MHLQIDLLWIFLCATAIGLAVTGRNRAARREMAAIQRQVGADLLLIAKMIRREWDARVAESGLLAILGLFAFASDSYPTWEDLKRYGSIIGAVALFGVVLALIIVSLLRLQAEDVLDRSAGGPRE